MSIMSVMCSVADEKQVKYRTGRNYKRGLQAEAQRRMAWLSEDFSEERAPSFIPSE